LSARVGYLLVLQKYVFLMILAELEMCEMA
jgi:hypothetical protein